MGEDGKNADHYTTNIALTEGAPPPVQRHWNSHVQRRNFIVRAIGLNMGQPRLSSQKQGTLSVLTK